MDNYGRYKEAVLAFLSYVVLSFMCKKYVIRQNALIKGLVTLAVVSRSVM